MSYDQYTADLLRENATLRTALAMHVRSLAALLDTNAVADEFANNVDPEWFGLLERIESLRDQMEVEKVVSEQLRALAKQAEADAAGIANVLGFFASCIKGGEPWTDECDKMLRAAFAHRTLTQEKNDSSS